MKYNNILALRTIVIIIVVILLAIFLAVHAEKQYFKRLNAQCHYQHGTNWSFNPDYGYNMCSDNHGSFRYVDR